MSKKIEIEASRKATQNLQSYFEEQDRRHKEGNPSLVPREPRQLSFLEPLWGKTPRHVWGQHAEFVIGEIIYPEGTDEELYNSSRVGIWNAATSELVFKRLGAVSICWNPDHSQIGIWCEYFNPNLTKQGNSRRDWLWEFERYCWESKELISSCKVSNEGYFWSVYAEFPKKYKGAIARLYVGCEEGGENVFILCDNSEGDRVLTYEEMEPLRKSRTFNLKQFWEDIRNPKLPPDEPQVLEITGERKNELSREVEAAFDIARRYKYVEIKKGFKNLGTVVDWIIINNWHFPKIAVHVTPKIVFIWKNPKNKNVALKIIFKSKNTVIEFTSKTMNECTVKEFNESNLRQLFKKLYE